MNSECYIWGLVEEVVDFREIVNVFECVDVGIMWYFLFMYLDRK